ncbi:MAG: SEC-C metal-binding domain-containing protein [Planctomycetota bacterium]|nr:SEC-C metal-binding domain-containing protein [Planctomycetota bacterium]
MELLERIWEYLGVFFGGLLRGFERSLTGMFGSSNARYIKKLQARVEAINNLEPKYEAMSEEELRGQTVKFRERLAAGETLDDILIEAFAIGREGGKRFLGMRHYDVQLIGGMVLHGGAIAEMITGEGKTLVATLPAYLNALEGKGVHVITVNDYLARRDMEWMAPLYMGLGLTVGAIQNDMAVLDRQKAYARDITYGTNNEFGFDYLRDNMRPAARGDERFEKRYQQSQGRLNFAIIDEVDNILIDEARTPLIISGPAFQDVRKYSAADQIARQLQKEEHFTVSEKDHSVTLTDEGVRAAEKLAGVESFYTAGNMEWPHLIDNSLKAHYLYKRDVNYVVKEGSIVIVDEFTGRLMEGRQWSDGLHQSVEAKEGVKIKEETQTLATITLQNFFKLYGKLCGMTGTAMTEANEFWKIYALDVIAIPPNRALNRISHPDVIYRTEREKFIAVADDIERHIRWDVLVLKNGDEYWGTIVKEEDDSVVLQLKEGKDKETIDKAKIQTIERKGRPVLVGTVSIEKSERLSELLDKRGVKHEVLNAKQHKREADIVAQAGRVAAVTIATNMAGRGTDIVLGGNAETMAWARLQHEYETRLDIPGDVWNALVEEIEVAEDMQAMGEHVKQLGGLHVVGTERHEARRIDLQLRGRCGRQGDPGSSRFYLSLEDDLMRIFAGPWVKSILERLGMQEGERIESKLVTRRIEAAQKKVEERNFEVRKNLLEYDEVMDEQRKRVYSYRQRILDGVNCRELVADMIREQVDHHLDAFTARDYAVDSFAGFVTSRFGMPFESKDFRGMDYDSAEQFAKDEAERLAEMHVFDAIEENLAGEEEEGEWNWEALAKFANTRWGLNLRDRDLKREGRDRVAQVIVDKARESIDRVDLSEGTQLLDADFAVRTIVAWVHHKFGTVLELDAVKSMELPDLKALVCQKAEECYDQKEFEYPVLAGLLRFTSGSGQHERVDREGLVAWAKSRFQSDIDVDDLRNKQREEIRALLLKHSATDRQHADRAREDAAQRIDKIFDSSSGGQLAAAAGSKGALQALSHWLHENLGCEMSVDEIGRLDRDELAIKVFGAVEDRYRPEIRRMERQLLLQIVDSAWKDHLLAMDHLRSAVGLAGYAQMDPKVEYKREGMRLFENMWTMLGERVTDLIFRMEQLDEGFVGSTWVETSARHDEARSASQLVSEQQRAIDGSQEVKVETIRNRADRIGRNDPCPCGSGRKYKQCCMRKNMPAA